MGGDSVWEQEKLEARKMLENSAESPASSALSWRHRPRGVAERDRPGRFVSLLFVKRDLVFYQIL